jgi:single-strand DNA-binding protein
VSGRIQTGSYDDKDTGKKVYTTDIVVEEFTFCESKAQNSQPVANEDGFVNFDDISEELPFLP